MVEIPDTTPLMDQETYYVSQTVSGFCESDLKSIKVYMQLSVEEALFNSLVYYPNPADHTLTITNDFPIDRVSLYSLSGQEIYTGKVDAETTHLDVSSLASGVYILKINIDGETGLYNIVKK